MNKKLVVVLSPKAEEVYNYLKKESLHSKKEKQIFDSINKKIELIKENPQYGMKVPHSLFPKDYINTYSISNLFRIELPLYWRMLYTLTNSEKIEIVAFVLDIMDHNEYNKKFKYK